MKLFIRCRVSTCSVNVSASDFGEKKGSNVSLDLRNKSVISTRVGL